MIAAVAQTLALILAEETSLRGTEQIDFNPPRQDRVGRAGLTVYCYSLRESQREPLQVRQGVAGDGRVSASEIAPRWFELSFLISAWDHTVLGEQQLLLEALTSLLGYRYLPGTLFSWELPQAEMLPVVVSPMPDVDLELLWRSLGVPLRPALYVTVTIPIAVRTEPPPQRQAVGIAC